MSLYVKSSLFVKWLFVDRCAEGVAVGQVPLREGAVARLGVVLRPV